MVTCNFSVGNRCIITSDESGYVCALLPSADLWRININDLPVSKVLLLLCVNFKISLVVYKLVYCWISMTVQAVMSLI